MLLNVYQKKYLALNFSTWKAPRLQLYNADINKIITCERPLACITEHCMWSSNRSSRGLGPVTKPSLILQRQNHGANTRAVHRLMKLLKRTRTGVTDQCIQDSPRRDEFGEGIEPYNPSISVHWEETRNIRLEIINSYCHVLTFTIKTRDIHVYTLQENISSF